jgi:hypothetical protein
MRCSILAIKLLATAITLTSILGGCATTHRVSGLPLDKPTADEREIAERFAIYLMLCADVYNEPPEHKSDTEAAGGKRAKTPGEPKGAAVAIRGFGDLLQSFFEGLAKAFVEIIEESFSDEMFARISREKSLGAILGTHCDTLELMYTYRAPRLELVYPSGYSGGVCRTALIDLWARDDDSWQDESPQERRLLREVCPPIPVRSLFSDQADQPRAKLDFDLYISSYTAPDDESDALAQPVDCYVRNAEFRQHRTLYLVKGKSWKIVRDERRPIGKEQTTPPKLSQDRDKE